ncbi:MAG: DUF2894 domain-containing protein [Trinickia sp.]
MDSGVDDIGGTSDTPPVRATLDAWRAGGADRVNPTRFRFIDALARRAAGHEGEVRRVLDERLAALIADYSRDIERAEAERAEAEAIVVRVDGAGKRSEPAHHAVAGAHSTPTQNVPRASALAELVSLLTKRATANPASEASASRGALDLPSHDRDRLPDLPVLDYFRETWSKFSTEKTLRQSLEQVPDNAGPLNSNSLIHRSLSLMRALSPGYLQQFLSYVEALSWMEQLPVPVAGAGTGAGAGAATAAAPAAEAARTGGAKKAVRGKATTR